MKGERVGLGHLLYVAVLLRLYAAVGRDVTKLHIKLCWFPPSPSPSLELCYSSDKLFNVHNRSI